MSVATKVLRTLTQDPSPPTGLGIGAIFESGKLNLTGYQRVRGEFVQDVAGTLVVDFRATPTGPVILTFTVPQDLTQPDFSYAYDIIMLSPYVEFTFTNGGVASTFFRASNHALTS